MKKLFTLMAVCLLALVSGCGGQQSSSPELADKGPVELHVSAAASLTDVMNEIGKAYEQEHPDVKVVFNYGSSGALQQAIENGGAADLFFSAAQKQMDALDKQGLLADGTREDLLQNEVVLIVPKEGGRGITSFDALTGDAVAHVALGAPKLKRIGMKVVGRGIVREHCDLYTMDGEKIGWASSGTFAPYIGCGVAMGYIPAQDIEIGKHLNADVRGRMVELEIVPMPFYKLER